MPGYEDFVIAVLLEQGAVTAEQVASARREGAERGVPATDVLVDRAVVGARAVAIARAGVCEAPYVDLEHYEVDARNAGLLPRQVAQGCAAFPLFVLDEAVTVVMADPLDLDAIDQVRAVLRRDVETVLAEREAIRRLIERAYALTSADAGMDAAEPVRAEPAGDERRDEPIVMAVNQIIAQAIDERASDVHIGPDEHELHVRYRIDGVLRRRSGPALAAHPAIIQRLKVMAQLDLTQTRRPQDGKFRFRHGQRQVDVRLSIIPTVCGENAVLRLLAGAAAVGTFGELGLQPDACEEMERLIRQPHGMLLVTGPTGSGKTTTLYAALSRLNDPERNIVTIEDPVEIRMPLVRQVQVSAEIGLTFAAALRSILRQDPDVVLLGEIRDGETASIAVQAALTGHLVLTTLHANDAPAAVARLLDLKVPAFAINASLLGVVAQRLVRRVCDGCTVPDQPDESLVERFGVGSQAESLRRGRGCAGCANTGFRGRLGVYELLRLPPPLKRLVDRGASTAELRRRALELGMRPMWRDGLDKALAGLTTIGEVARVAAGGIVADSADARDEEPACRLSA
jgi:type IV pilus assembly protein PilB